MKQTLLFLLILLLSPLAVLAGQWQAYTYTDQYRRVFCSNNNLYILKGNSIVVANAETWQVERELNRENGLTSNDIIDACFSYELGSIAVVYNDGNIDVLHPDGSVWSIPDLYLAPMAGIDKSINSIREQQGLLFIHTAYGFAVADLESNIILQNFNLGTSVKCAWAFDGNWFYSNNLGSFYCPQKDSNPHIAANWRQTGSQQIERTIVLENAGIEQCWQTDKDRRLHKIIPGTHTSTRCFDGGTITDLQRCADLIMASASDSLVLYDTRLGLPPVNAEDLLEGQRIACRQSSPLINAKVNGICPLDDEYSNMVFMYSDNGLITGKIADVSARTFSVKSNHKPWLTIDNYQQSPLINRIVTSANGEIGMSQILPLNTGYSAMLKIDGFLTTYNTQNGTWNNYTKKSVTDYLTSGNIRFCAVNEMVADPNYPSRYWFSTLEDGIVGIENGQLYTRYDAASTNNGLEVCAPKCTRIGGIGFNNEGDMWCFDEGHNYGVRVLRKADGKWYRFKIEGLEKSYGFVHLCVTRRNGHHQVWGYQQFKYEQSNVFCYDYGTSITSDEDDRYVFFKTLKSVSPEGMPFTPYYARNIYEGPTGAIWLLNTSGIYLIDDPAAVFDHPGEVRTVMNDVVPTSMCIDSHDRVWIGTEDQGVLLFSGDGKKLIAQFNSDNSIMYSGGVQSVAYEPLSSTLWVATSGQILSYQYDPIEFDDTDADTLSTAYCYPTEVQYETNTLVNVFGLKDDTKATITNSQGRIQQQSVAIGNTISIDPSQYPVGTYYVTGTDCEGHYGQLVTFEVLP